MINAKWENKVFIYYYRKSRAQGASKKMPADGDCGALSLRVELFNPTYGKVLLFFDQKSKQESFWGASQCLTELQAVLCLKLNEGNANQCHSILSLPNNFLHVILSIFLEICIDEIVGKSKSGHSCITLTFVFSFSCLRFSFLIKITHDLFEPKDSLYHDT